MPGELLRTMAGRETKKMRPTIISPERDLDLYLIVSGLYQWKMTKIWMLIALSSLMMTSFMSKMSSATLRALNPGLRMQVSSNSTVLCLSKLMYAIPSSVTCFCCQLTVIRFLNALAVSYHDRTNSGKW